MQDTSTGRFHEIEDTSQKAKDKVLPRERQGITLEIGQNVRVAGQTMRVHNIDKRSIILQGTDLGGPEFLDGAPIDILGAHYRVQSVGNKFVVLTPATATEVTRGDEPRNYTAFIAMPDGAVREFSIVQATAMEAWRAAAAECRAGGGRLFEIR